MSNLFNPPKYVELRLVGLDGNAFSLLGAFQRAARRQGWNSEDIQKVLEEAKSSDYDHLLFTLTSHCNDPENFCGDPNAEPNTAEYVGLIESLWVIFGGKVNAKGYKVLDPHIGAIYGDSITLDRFEEILKQLKEKGFASSNIVVGVGSYTYQYNTRDTFGFAVKSTYSVVNERERFLFKDPKTDDGTKRSQCGMVAVLENGTRFVDELKFFDYQELAHKDELKEVFRNGELEKHFTLDQIRENIDKELELH